MVALDIDLLPSKKLTRVSISDDDLTFVEFDATLSANHQSTATITNHPVEEGADVTDHIRDESDTLTINGIVSNDPPIALKSFRAKPSRRGGDPRSRAEDAYEELRRFKKEGRLLKVTTKLRDYTNMAISSVSTVQDNKTGEITNIVLSLQEIVIAFTQTVAAPEPENLSRTKRIPQGKKSKVPSPATSVASKKSTSVALSLIRG